MELEEPKQQQPKHEKVRMELHHLPIIHTPAAVKSLKYGPQAQLVAVGRENGLLSLYRDRSQDLYGNYFSLISPITSIIWIDSQHILTSYLSGTINLFNLASPFPVSKYQLPPEISIYCMLQLKNDTFVLACSDSCLRIIILDEKLKLYIGYQSQTYDDSQCLHVDAVDKVVYASYSNGFLRSFIFKTPSSLVAQQAINLYPDNKGKKNAIPWVVKVTNQYVFIGTSTGVVHVYEREFLTEVIKIQTHQAAILTGLIQNNVAYFSGSDSLIVCINCKTLKIIGSARGQSNDIFALEKVENRLISSGINTDLCFYNLDTDGNITSTNGFFRILSSPIRSCVQIERFGKNVKYNSLLLATNNYSSITLGYVDDIFNQDQVNVVAEIQTIDLINIVRLSVKCTYLLYSHQSQTMLMKVQLDSNKFKTMQKVLTFEPVTEAVFDKGAILYYINQKGQLYSLEISTSKKTFIVNTEILYPTSLRIFDNLLIVQSKIEEKVISYDMDDEFRSQELNLNLPDHKLSSVSIEKAQFLNVIATYTNNRFATFIYTKTLTGLEDDQQFLWGWKLSKYSKDFLFRLPNNFIHFKNVKDTNYQKNQLILGGVCASQDEKKLLLYTNHELIRVHLRGRPPTETTQMDLEKEVDEERNLHVAQNFTFVRNEQSIISMVPMELKQLKGSKQITLLLEWDKINSFKVLPQAINAKKYNV